MKIFITGASGFVGQYLVKELLAHNYEVVALARNAAASSLLQVSHIPTDAITMQSSGLLRFCLHHLHSNVSN